MIGITNAGGGITSNRYRISVVYGAPDPSMNPKEWDIFIRTSVPLTIGAITTNATAAPGFVANNGHWYVNLTTGTISDAPEVKLAKNERLWQYITGRPAQAWEWIDGQWRKMNAYIWYKNQWVQFSWSYNGELFANGNQYTEYTGGWTGMVRNASVSPSVSDPANPNLFSDANGVAGGTAWFRTVNKVDMSNYRTLKWTGWGFGENSGGKYGAHCTVHDNPSTDSGIISDASFQNEGTYSMDISGISGAHYITFRAMGSGAQRVSISRVWME